MKPFLALLLVAIPLPPTITSHTQGLPAPAVGYTTERITSTTDFGVPTTDQGAARFVVGYSHFAADDPIVYPNQPGASHMHVFFGNTGVNAYTTSLRPCASTSAGGTANCSSYWVPALKDQAGTWLVPGWNNVYYKDAYKPGATLKPLPVNLKMLAGESVDNVTPHEQWQSHYFITCTQPDGHEVWRGAQFQACAAGNDLLLAVSFPDCWDGINLDSPGHRSHMAYSADGRCPVGQPVPVPMLSQNVHYTVKAGQNVAQFKLASDRGGGGLSMHGDAWIGWDPDVEGQWMGCLIARKDCHDYLLGNGRTTY